MCLRFLCFLLLPLTAFSQTQQGSFLVGLRGFTTQYKYKEQRSIIGDIKIEAGYALFNNLFLGVKYRPFYSIDFKSKSRFAILEYGLFSRYYFLKNRVRPYLHTDFNQTISGIQFSEAIGNVAIGIDYFLSKNAALEGHLNYNYYKRYSDNNTIFDDPISSTENDPQGFDFSFGIRFFIPSGMDKAAKINRPILADRYLKKGNKTISISGFVDFKPINYLGTFEMSKFLSDNTKLQHRYLGYGNFRGDGSTQGYSSYNANLEHYFKLYRGLYFIPSVGAGPVLYYRDGFRDNYLGGTGTAQAGMVQFFKSSNIGAGFSMTGQRYFNKEAKTFISSNLYLSSEIYLTEKLAFKPILYYNLSDYPTTLYFAEDRGFDSVSGLQLRMGFSYYY